MGDPDLKGFREGFTDGTYGYLVPHYNGAYYGKVARFNLNTFGDVQVLDLTSTDSDLKGFLGGFSDGTYGYLVPYNNGAYYGKVARFTLNTFGDVQVLDLTSTDSDLQGFTGGFTDRTYGYVVLLGKLRLWARSPSGTPLGKVPRFTLSTFGGMVSTTTSP